MANYKFLTDLPLAGELVAENFEGWPDWLKAEFAEHANDGHVGSRLLSHNSRARVWEIRLAPGQRWHAHRHVLDYFWSALNAGRARAHLDDGSTIEHTYTAGETRHETYGSGEFKVHDLENIGDADLVFMTVESIDRSANKPLPIPQAIRPAKAA